MNEIIFHLSWAVGYLTVVQGCTYTSLPCPFGFLISLYHILPWCLPLLVRPRAHSRNSHQYAFIALSVLVMASVSWGGLFFHFIWVLYYFHFQCTLPSTVCNVISACHREYLHNCDGPGGIRCFCSLSAGVPKWGLYGVAEQNGGWRTVLYNGFRFVLGYRDWPTLNTQWRWLSCWT